MGSRDPTVRNDEKSPEKVRCSGVGPTHKSNPTDGSSGLPGANQTKRAEEEGTGDRGEFQEKPPTGQVASKRTQKRELVQLDNGSFLF